jgi:hypothetical protein
MPRGLALANTWGATAVTTDGSLPDEGFPPPEAA